MWVIDLYCRLFHSGSSNHISESELYVFLSHIFVFYCLFFVCYCIMSILWKHRRMLNSKKEVSLYCNQSSVQTQMIYERTVVDLSSEIWVSVKAQASLKIEQIWLSLNRCYFLQNTHLKNISTLLITAKCWLANTSKLAILAVYLTRQYGTCNTFSVSIAMRRWQKPYFWDGCAKPTYVLHLTARPILNVVVQPLFPLSYLCRKTCCTQFTICLLLSDL